MKTTCLFLLGLAFCWGLFSCTAQQPKPEEVIEIINRVNPSATWALFLGQCRLSYGKHGGVLPDR